MKSILTIVVGTTAFLASKSALAEELLYEAKKAMLPDYGFQTAVAITAGLAIALACFGGALAQGKVSTAAMEGIARNPEAAGKIMTPMIISLALIESLVIYVLVIAFLLQGKI